MKSLMKSLTLCLMFLMSACATAVKISPPDQFTSRDCQVSFEMLQHQSLDRQLDRMSKLFRASCFKEVLRAGSKIREAGHDKFYSMTGEFVEYFTPEGSATPYVMESYERGYLSLLIALSYLNLKQNDAAMVELERVHTESKARLYNYGDDPVIALMEAALRDRSHPAEARPFWKKFAELSADPQASQFAKKRISEIDENRGSEKEWEIYTCGQIPDYDWGMSFKKVYEIKPVSRYPETFTHDGALAFSTRSWNRKITGRYLSSYHPYLFTKSVLRLSTGLAYGVVGVASGLTVGVGGCLLGTGSKDSSNEICKAAFEIGGAMISKSADLVSYTVRPDMRRWSEMPAMVVVAPRGSDTIDICPSGFDHDIELYFPSSLTE